MDGLGIVGYRVDGCGDFGHDEEVFRGGCGSAGAGRGVSGTDTVEENAMKTASFRLLLGAAAGVWFGAGVALGACGGDSEVAGEWIFEPEAEAPGWAINSGGDGDMGNLGLTGGAAFSTNVPPVNCDCGHSLGLAGTNGTAGAVSLGDYDPLAGAEKFTVMAWVRRESASGENLSARIFSDADSTSLTNTTAGVEFRFSGSAGNLALRINGTEVATTVGGVAPESGEWHHVAAVYDGTRAATNYTTRNVHFYVDGIQRGVGSVLQNAVVATNYAPVVVGNAAASRTAANLLAGNVDDVLVAPGWAPDAAGNGNANAAIQCFMEGIDDIFPPYILAPPDIEAEADECLAPVAVALGTPAVGDDCLVVSVTNDAPAFFPIGTNVVTWTVRDEAGNTATCTQTVTVVPSRTGDCDEDGLTDWQEVVVYGTDWACADTDGDGLDDGEEAELETSPLLPDSDGDGWSDGEEVLAETDPLDFLSAPRLARGVLLHAVKYAAAGDSQWVQMHCSGPREVDLSGFRLQVAGTNWETRLTFPENTWMVPGHFMLVGGTSVTNADIEADLSLPGSYPDLPTAGVRLMAPANSTNAPVDVLMYGTHVPFNEQGLDTTGWLSETTNLWASSSRHLERWAFGRDTDREADWRHIQDGALSNGEEFLDSDGDGLTDDEEYTGAANGQVPTNPLSADMDGDGLLDGYETRVGLNPCSRDSDGDGIDDGEEINPSDGRSHAECQLADGLQATPTASKAEWKMGESIGTFGTVAFTLTGEPGTWVWGTIVEGGDTPEPFSASVSGGTVEYAATNLVDRFQRVNFLLALGEEGSSQVLVVDAGYTNGVTQSNSFGADITASFQVARLDISMPYTSEATEEEPGEYVGDILMHPMALRSNLTIAPCWLYGFPGELELTWGGTVRLQKGETSLQNVVRYRGLATRARGDVLHVAGNGTGTSEILWKSVLFPFVNDCIRVTSVNVTIASIERVVPREGNEKEVAVAIAPTPLPGGASLGLEISRTRGSAGEASVIFPADGKLSQSENVTIRGTEQSLSDGEDGDYRNMALCVFLPGHDEVLESSSFLICAHPVHFRETSNGINALQHALLFTYTWDSDSGAIQDLDKVWVGEKVSYNDRGIHTGPDRPWHKDDSDPTIKPKISDFSGIYGEANDLHHPPGFILPDAGPAHSYTATQHYGFRCERCGAGKAGENPQQSIEVLLGPMSIFREVYNGLTGWRYRIRKGSCEMEFPL